VKEDTTAIIADTTVIKDNTSQIPLIKQDTELLAQEIASLRLQVTVLKRTDRIDGTVLRRFLDETTEYAQTVLDEHISDGRSELNLKHPTKQIAPPATEQLLSSNSKIKFQGNLITQTLDNSRTKVVYYLTSRNNPQHQTLRAQSTSRCPNQSLALRYQILVLATRHLLPF
jgi:hypothetical protein